MDDSFGAASSFLASVGLIAMLWFGIGLALLLRPFDGELPRRSAFLAGAGVGSVLARAAWTESYAMAPLPRSGCGPRCSRCG